jgi:hypothetical protein
MKVSQNFGILYVLLIICQVLMSTYTQLGPYIMLSMLPAMVLCIPTGVKTTICMLIAFASGLAVDWLSEGFIGLNIAALLPVALLRKGIIRIFLGEDIINRNDTFSIRRNGIGKVSFALISSVSIFLALHIFLDGAGTRPLWFCMARFGASLACNWLVGLLVINILTPDDRK